MPNYMVCGAQNAAAFSNHRNTVSNRNFHWFCSEVHFFMFKKVATNYFVLWILQVFYESSVLKHHQIELSSFGLSLFQGLRKLRVSLFARAHRSVLSEQPLVHERSNLCVEHGLLFSFFLSRKTRPYELLQATPMPVNALCACNRRQMLWDSSQSLGVGLVLIKVFASEDQVA